MLKIICVLDNATLSKKKYRKLQFFVAFYFQAENKYF